MSGRAPSPAPRQPPRAQSPGGGTSFLAVADVLAANQSLIELLDASVEQQPPAAAAAAAGQEPSVYYRALRRSTKCTSMLAVQLDEMAGLKRAAEHRNAELLAVIRSTDASMKSVAARDREMAAQLRKWKEERAELKACKERCKLHERTISALRAELFEADTARLHAERQAAERQRQQVRGPGAGAAAAATAAAAAAATQDPEFGAFKLELEQLCNGFADAMDRSGAVNSLPPECTITPTHIALRRSSGNEESVDGSRPAPPRASSGDILASLQCIASLAKQGMGQPRQTASGSAETRQVADLNQKLRGQQQQAEALQQTCKRLETDLRDVESARDRLKYVLMESITASEVSDEQLQKTQQELGGAHETIRQLMRQAETKAAGAAAAAAAAADQSGSGSQSIGQHEEMSAAMDTHAAAFGELQAELRAATAKTATAQETCEKQQRMIAELQAAADQRETRNRQLDNAVQAAELELADATQKQQAAATIQAQFRRGQACGDLRAIVQAHASRV
eukprot:SAG22_NODE_1801_length_3538_cov_4.250581_1_plen_511_part_10